MEQRDEEKWKIAMERAIVEATHDSEIPVRAMVYYRALVIGIGIGPAWDQPESESEKQ